MVTLAILSRVTSRASLGGEGESSGGSPGLSGAAVGVAGVGGAQDGGWAGLIVMNEKSGGLRMLFSFFWSLRPLMAGVSHLASSLDCQFFKNFFLMCIPEVDGDGVGSLLCEMKGKRR